MKKIIPLVFLLTVCFFSCKSGGSSVDASMQEASKDMLSKNMSAAACDSAVFIVLDTRTGEVRTGLKLLKDFAGSEYVEAPEGRLELREQPGGIVIPFTVMGAMEKASLLLTEPVDAGIGRVVLHERTVYDQDVFDKGGYGMIDLGKCVTLPSFVGTVKTLETVYDGKLELFEKQMRAMSLGMPDDENPFDNTPNFEAKMNAFSVGFYFNISPVQLVAAWNGLANDGRMVKPVWKTADTATINPVMCKPATVSAMKKLLTDNAAAEYGSAQDMAFLKNINSIRNTYKRAVTATFAGWFPAASPRYTCLLVMYHSELPDADPEKSKAALIAGGKQFFRDFATSYSKTE